VTRATARILDGRVEIVIPARQQGTPIAAQDPQTGIWHQVMHGTNGRIWTSPIGHGPPPTWYAIATPAARWRRTLLWAARAPRRLTRAILPRQ
jgi:hypothetical protein